MVSGTIVVLVFLTFIVMGLAALADAAATFRSVEECPHREEANPLFYKWVHDGRKGLLFGFIIAVHLGGGAIISFALSQIQSPQAANFALTAIAIVALIKIIVNAAMALGWTANLNACREGRHG